MAIWELGRSSLCRLEGVGLSTAMPPCSSPSPASPATDVRGAIDDIAEDTLRELLEAYDVALTPFPASSAGGVLHFYDVTATIDFVRETPSSSHQTGRLVLSMPRDVFLLLSPEPNRASLRDDWAPELANQLMGRIKNRLLQFGSTLQIGIPATSDADAESRRERAATHRVYTGRTVRGDVLLTLEGLPEESELAHVGPEGLALEGELILF